MELLRKKSHGVALLLLFATLFLAFCAPASADIGPKASVHITFSGLPAGECWATLLSEHEICGPSSVWREEDALRDGWDVTPADRAFASYDDPDGYFYLGVREEVSTKKELVWGYYPPSNFKILVWIPETGAFVSSGILGRYAFDTYYNATLGGTAFSSVEYDDVRSGNERYEKWKKESEIGEFLLPLVVTESYDFGTEALLLCARIALTLLVELLLALAFGYRTGGELLFIALANVVTQIGLNLYLHVLVRGAEGALFVFLYLLGEALVFVCEAVFYALTFGKKRGNPGNAIVYALVANLVSFAGGCALSLLLPKF